MTFCAFFPSHSDFRIERASQNKNIVRIIKAARLKGDGVGWSKRGSEAGAGGPEPFGDFSSCSASDSFSVRSLSEPMSSLSVRMRGSFSSASAVGEVLGVDIL